MKAKETDASSDLVVLGKALRPAGSSGLDLSLRKSNFRRNPMGVGGKVGELVILLSGTNSD